MKRMISILLCVTLILSAWTIAAPLTVFGDYTFTTADVRTILAALANGATIGDPLAAVADRDGDGSIDSADARTILLMVLSGNATVDQPEEPQGDTDDNGQAFRLSSLSDVTGSNGTRSYVVQAPYTDTYTLTSSTVRSMLLYDNGKVIASGSSRMTVSLTAGECYTLSVVTAASNASFSVETKADNHLVTLPYDVAEPIDTSNFSLYNNSEYYITPATLNYQKREGGTYIYSNNPEMIPSDAVGDAFIRTEDLTGEVYLTFEHSNAAGRSFYLGYQLKNEGTTDVYVTVTNIGYQTSGTWLGQEAWYDFYNTTFDLADYYDPNDQFNIDNYGYDTSYTARVYQPTTYRLPAGEAFYVIGGTTSDAYRGINVDGTANQAVGVNRCATGNVKFYVTGGAVTGTMYCYNSTSQVAAEPAVTGYRTGAYALQYTGVARHSGVIDNYATWTFNDHIAGMLPVTYTNFYDANVPASTTPYAAYNSTAHTHKGAVSWHTHLNPQNLNTAVGTDMVEFTCVDQYGVTRVIDNDHADGSGAPANTGNWMIEYQDHFTFVNQGNKARTVRFEMKDSGSLAMLVRDSQTGEVIDATLTAGASVDYSVFSYTYEITIPAHSVKQITLDYLLVGNSAGTVKHQVILD